MKGNNTAWPPRPAAPASPNLSAPGRPAVSAGRDANRLGRGSPLPRPRRTAPCRDHFPSFLNVLVSTDPSMLEGGEKFSREKALPALRTAPPLSPPRPAAGGVKQREQSPARRPPLPRRCGIRSRPRQAARVPARGLPAPAGQRALAAEEGDPASAPHRRATLPGPPGARRPNLGVSRRAHARESWLHWRAGPGPRRCGGAVSGVGERERDLPRGLRVCCAAGPRSPPTAGTRGHCRKPTRPAQAASRPRPPIPHAGAPHWLRSFISRGASLFPARQRISRLPAFSGS